MPVSDRRRLLSHEAGRSRRVQFRFGFLTSSHRRWLVDNRRFFQRSLAVQSEAWSSPFVLRAPGLSGSGKVRPGSRAFRAAFLFRRVAGRISAWGAFVVASPAYPFLFVCCLNMASPARRAKPITAASQVRISWSVPFSVLFFGHCSSGEAKNFEPDSDRSKGPGS